MKMKWLWALSISVVLGVTVGAFLKRKDTNAGMDAGVHQQELLQNRVRAKELMKKFVDKKMSTLDDVIDIALDDRSFGVEISEVAAEEIKNQLFGDPKWWVAAASHSNPEKLEQFIRRFGVITSDSQYPDMDSKVKAASLRDRIERLNVKRDGKKSALALIRAGLPKQAGVSR